MFRHFNFFFNSFSLTNINFIFFALEQKVEAMFPRLNRHFRYFRLSLAMVFMANFLTIFIAFADPQNLDHVVLDIIDIFLVESWPGLIRVVLLILKVQSRPGSLVDPRASAAVEEFRGDA